MDLLGLMQLRDRMVRVLDAQRLRVDGAAVGGDATVVFFTDPSDEREYVLALSLAPKSAAKVQP